MSHYESSLGRTSHVDKLWRVLYSPRSVFDELRDDLQVALPILALFGATFITSILLLILHPLASPTTQEIDEYRNQLLQLEDEPDQEYAIARRKELREQFFGPDDSTVDRAPNARIVPRPINLVAQPLGLLVLLLLHGTSFWILGKMMKSDLRWNQWFGLVCWSHLPVVAVLALDAVLLAMGSDSRLLFSFSFGNAHIAATTGVIWGSWSFVIAVQALRSWTAKGLGACIGWVLASYLQILVPMAGVASAIKSVVSVV